MISVCVGTVRPTTVRTTVEALLRQDYRAWELLLIAQGNDSALLQEVEQLTTRDTRIKVIHTPHFGRSRALNLALRHAQGDICAFTDDDCEPMPDWLTTIQDCFTSDASVGLVAGDLVAPQAPASRISTCPATYTIECIYRPSSSGFRGPPGFYWGGANFAVRQSLFASIGPFDEYLGPGTDFPAAEDVDFALRAEALDVTMWTTPRSQVLHTFGRRSGIQAVMKHHRNYARGSGALLGKLELWQHHLAPEWGRTRTLTQHLKEGLLHLPRYCLGEYKGYFAHQAKQEYLRRFRLNAQKVSTPIISSKQ